MRRQLSEQQIDALLARLRALKLRPDALFTICWQFGWMVPPIQFSTHPFSLLMLLWYLWIVVLLLLTIAALVMHGMALALGAMCAGLIGQFVLSAWIRVRSRSQAWLALAAMGIGASLFMVALPIAVFPPILAVDWNLVDFDDPALVYGLIGGLAGPLIGLPLGRSKLKRRRNLPSWQELLDELTTTEAF